MKDYKQTTRDIFRKRDEYLARRKKRIAYIEKGVSIMSITGILVALGLCTSMSSSIAPVPQDEPHEIDINSGISTVTSQTAQTAKFLQTARTSQNSTSILTSTGLISTSEDITSNSSSDVTSDTAASSAVRSVLTSTGSSAEETKTSAVSETGTTVSTTGTTQETTDTTAVSTTKVTTGATESIPSVTVSASYEPAYSVDNPFYEDSETTIVFPYYDVTGSYVYDNVISYRLLENGTYADTVYIDPAELENGDYTLSCGMYLEGVPEIFSDMMHLHAFVDGFYEDGVHCKYLTFGDITTHQYQWNDDRINMMLNEIESSIVRYVGYRSKSDCVSAGPNKILIKDENTGKDLIFDLDVDERTGEAFTIIEEEWYKNTNGKHGYLKIPHYDPETPYGERFIRELNEIDMHCLSKRAGAWINEVTGDNQMAKFDVTIDQDTPEGVYYVGFALKKNYNSMSNAYGVTLIPTNVYSRMSDEDINVTINHNDMDYWLKIVVGGTEEEKAVTEEETYDVNQDGAIGLADASGVLTTYAERAAGTASGIQLLKSVAADYDIDRDGEISVSDATAILTKYAEKAAGV